MMKKERNQMDIKTKVIAVTAAAVILLAGTAGTVGYVSAQEGGANPTPPAATQQPKNKQDRQQRRDNFLQRVADKLNVSLEQLKQSFKDSAIDAVNASVADGKITQDQATKMIDRINKGNGAGLGHFLRAHGNEIRAFRVKVRAGVIQSAATALNVQPADLRTQLKDGKSIADVATTQNVSLDTVKTQITTDAKTKLDAAVTNKKLTQGQADKALQTLTNNLDKILNAKRAPKPATTP